MRKPPITKRVLFYRRLRQPDAGTNGGNLKLRDAYDHFADSADWEPEIYFAPDTVWRPESSNLWTDLRPTARPHFQPERADLLFFSGHDWLALPQRHRPAPPVPVLNIVQPRHVREHDKRRAFLQFPAIRIAKSETGAAILREHGVNGPLFVVPDGIDLAGLPPVPDGKDIDVLIPGLKQPELARQVHQQLTDWNEREGLGLNIYLQLPPKLATRRAFLELVARAKVIACIPLDLARGGEGFYLPALEAMALRTLVVCPHAVGNVDHCRDGENCLVPAFTMAGITEGVTRMLALTKAEKTEMRAAGERTAQAHDLVHERRALLDLADRAADIWSNKKLFLPSVPTKRRESGFRKFAWWTGKKP